MQKPKFIESGPGPGGEQDEFGWGTFFSLTFRRVHVPESHHASGFPNCAGHGARQRGSTQRLRFEEEEGEEKEREREGQEREVRGKDSKGKREGEGRQLALCRRQSRKATVGPRAAHSWEAWGVARVKGAGWQNHSTFCPSGLWHGIVPWVSPSSFSLYAEKGFSLNPWIPLF